MIQRFSGLLLLLYFHIALADNWNGFDYVHNSSVQMSHGERLLQHLSLKENDHILDIGCGDGRIAILLAKRVPQGLVLGIDPSVSMLAKAEENFLQEKDLSNLTFYKESAETFSFKEPFDHIISIFVMHWIQEQATALKNIFNHLKPNGHVHFIIAPSKEGLPFDKALQKTLKAWKEDFIGFVNPQQTYDMETYRKLMVDAGFHIEGIHYIYHDSLHENREKLKGWLKQWQPHIKSLEPVKQSLFLEELMNHYLIEIGISTDTKDPILWGEYVLIVEGSKK